MRILRWSPVLALLLCGCGQTSPGVKLSPAPAPKGLDDLMVQLRKSDQARRGELVIKFDKDGRPEIPDIKPVNLNEGTVEANGQKVAIYLPSQGPYRLENTGGENKYENNATVLSIDNDGDRQLPDHEKWSVDQPVRIGDSMFAVKEIAPDGGWLRLARSTEALEGAVVGRPSPDFTYKVAGGQRVSLKDYRGKWLILDVWSMT
jgi:hypothetical protein